MTNDEPTLCWPSDDDCWNYMAGHQMHFIHANHIGRTPWGWRDGTIESHTSDGWVVVRYLLDDGLVRVWHHVGLSHIVEIGGPVRVHERYYALGGPFGWLNVCLRDGLGAVTEPASTEFWAQEAAVGIVDTSTGRGLAVDHPDSDQESGRDETPHRGWADSQYLSRS